MIMSTFNPIRRRLNSFNLKQAGAVCVVTVFCLMLTACGAPKIKLFSDSTEPLKEFRLQGKADEKILLLPVEGVISDARREGFFRAGPSLVEEVVSQLRMAEKDKDIKAVLLKVDSPGGTITASDVLYEELMRFKRKTKAKIVVSMMGMATSGGYYISLPADRIMAHPTTVTGSVGAILFMPAAFGLMDKIGVDVNVSKSGKNKDMGSPFRKLTPEEEALFGHLTESLGNRFTHLVAEHRKINQEAMKEISTARIYLAPDALKVGLIDSIGYLDDAVAEAKTLASLPEDAQVVVYRRTEYPNDNLYNTTTTQYEGSKPALVDLGISEVMPHLRSGFYFIWPVAVGR